MGESKALLLTVPDYGDGLVLIPVDAVEDIRNGTDEEGEPLRIEDAMLDELDDELVEALMDAGLARVEEPLGSFEVLVIPADGRAAVIALAESLGFSVQS